ncbi:MAG: nucleotidyltransferase family protein [Desulfobacterales bacterium]|nr:nucleotidyltransferase family protein [Desulfobacterales bacterium]
MIARSKALFACLERNRVKYVVIGGVAAILHGVPRMTGDIDIFIEASLENAESMLNTLRDLGYETSELVTPDGFIAVKLLIFENSIKIDVMLSIPGVDFAAVWANKIVQYAGDQKFYIISKADLIASKLAADVAVLTKS